MLWVVIRCVQNKINIRRKNVEEIAKKRGLEHDITSMYVRATNKSKENLAMVGSTR